MTDLFEPTPKPSRTSNVISLRLAPSGLEWVDQYADKHDVTRTEVVKAALAFAAQQGADFNKMIKNRNSE